MAAKLRIALAKRERKKFDPCMLQTVGINRDCELH